MAVSEPIVGTPGGTDDVRPRASEVVAANGPAPDPTVDAGRVATGDTRRGPVTPTVGAPSNTHRTSRATSRNVAS